LRKKLNVDSLFIEAYARAIGVMAMSTIFTNLENIKITKIMKNFLVFSLAGVALVWGLGVRHSGFYSP
jgi:hypothetical protein